MDNRYRAADIETCAARGHHFQLIGSDKTPMKQSLLCKTCTILTGIDTLVAWGTDIGSFGQWRRMRETEQVEN